MVVDSDPKNKLYVYMHDKLAGELTYDGIYQFRYDSGYLNQRDSIPLSLSLPLVDKAVLGPYKGKEIPLYFFHLLPEGWLLNLAKMMKIAINDPMEVLSLFLFETIGAVRVSKNHNAQISPSKLDLADEPLILESDPSGSAEYVKRHKFCLFCGVL